MKRNIAVLGTGAIGSSIGADLTKAGYNVLLVDQWPAHVEVMKIEGLHLVMREEEFHTPVQALHLCELSAVRPQLDIVFLAPKSYDSCWMAQLIKPYLQPDGVIVSTQNSLNDEWVAPIVGLDRDIGCALELSAGLYDPGRVERRTDRTTTKFVLGELDGRITPRVQEIAQILNAVGKTKVSTNIWGAKWTKLVLNTMHFGVGAILGLRTREILQNSELMGLCIKLGKETAHLASALGITLEPIFGLTPEDFQTSTEESIKKLWLTIHSELGRVGDTCVAQDLKKGRLTEIGYLNGLVVKKGQQAKVDTPLNAAVTSVIEQIEQRIIHPGLPNLKMLERYAF